MTNFDKHIVVGDGRIIKFNIFMFEKNQLEPPIYSFEEYFIKDDEIQGSYKMSKNGGYNFSGWINTNAKAKEKTKSLSYDFDINHPLYIPLLHLLNEDDILVIDDEKTEELDKKYMMINKEKDKISIFFINNLEKDDLEKRFNISVKSKYTSPYSKIDRFQLDTKKRLDIFFKEATEVLSEERHQISIEEYLLRIYDSENEEVKKYVKSMIPIRK